MKLTNSSERWGAVTQLMHWTVVVLVIVQFTMANIADDLPLGMQKLAWLARHKSVGITILGIVTARLLWRLLSPGPALPSNLGPVERLLASVTHVGLYVVLFLMPLTGWLMSSAKGYPVSWFNLVQLPDFIAKNEEAFKVFKASHEMLSLVLIVLVLLHVAGAFKHHFIYKDSVLKRMLPVLAVAVVAVPVFPSPALAGELVSDPGQSKLTFTFTQAGGLNSGRFAKFNVQLSEPEGAIAGGSLAVTIDTQSLDTSDTERDDLLRGADLFDTKRFPVARFIAQQIEPDGDERFRAVGTLAIRDKSLPLQLPLTVRRATEAGTEVTYLTGEVAINRLDYGVGQGEWRSTEWVADKVSIAWSIRFVPDDTRAHTLAR
ncbi:MAG TPA: cytochrome b/b6 domain-containing protein [Halioglobus sp.]